MAGKRFHNPPGSPKRNVNPLKWTAFIWRRLMPHKPDVKLTYVLQHEEVIKQFKAITTPSVTWLGHNCFLLRFKRTTILTDPFLSDYASPFAGIGPKRYVAPALSIAELPNIDLILVTHDHYDHLDLKTLAQLSQKETTQVVAPLGLAPLFQRCGYQRITELNWYESFQMDNVNITALPAIHFSKRSFWDRDTHLWASFAININGLQIYFSCNTAYGSHFSEIGKLNGKFDYAFVDIGAYEPAELMQEAHVTPEQAVQIGLDLQAKTLIPMHWGTIKLSDEPILEPPERFIRAGEAAGYSREHLWLMKIGESRQL